MFTFFKHNVDFFLNSKNRNPYLKFLRVKRSNVSVSFPSDVEAAEALTVILLSSLAGDYQQHHHTQHDLH